MSARAIASATISFGLVSIPIKVYASGESAAAVRFNMLHRDCGSRVKQQYVCPKDEKVVSRDELAKGYEFAKGQYVMFSPEELKALEAASTQTVEIAEFIPTSKIDPIYFEKSYYLGPDKGGDRAYRLLARALVKSGRSALATYAARGKQYLVLLRPHEDALVMQQLRYADEIRPISEIPLGDVKVKSAELKLALQIVEQGVNDSFEPEKFEDTVRQRVMERIEHKVAGREITLEPAEQPGGQVIDLMEALKKSLSGSKAAGAKSAARKPAKRAARKTTKAGKKTTKKNKASRS